MATSVIVWQCITIFCYILQPVCTGATKTSKACHGARGQSCTQHDISCNNTQKIAIYDAYYTNNTECGTGLANCATVNPENVTEHGYHRFNNTELVSLYHNCSTEKQCVYYAPRRNAVLTFSVVEYQCIKTTELMLLDQYKINNCKIIFEDDKQPEGELLNISGGVAERSSQVSHIRREPNSTIKTINYTCRFKSDVNATSISVYALDARSGRGTQGPCFLKLSVLPENIITMNNCSSVFQPFERLNVTAELPASLNLMDIPRSSSTLIWLLINASEPFMVTCEPVTGAGTSTGTTISHTFSVDNNNHISTGSSRLTMAIDIIQKATKRNYIPTTTESSRMAATNNTVAMYDDTHTADDTGAIIGGVVATVLAILVVTVVSVRLIRNRREKSEGKENNASFPLDVQPDMAYSLAGTIPQDNYHEIQDLKTQSSDYDYATVDGKAIPQNANILELAEKQNAKQFSKASTTESDYDHIGDKASPQTSDYDTTASVVQAVHTGGTIGEDDYGYNLFHKKTKPQTHQNDYDTAASATKSVAQLDRADRNTDDDDYDHFPSVTNHPETVSSPYETASGMEDNSDCSVSGPMK